MNSVRTRPVSTSRKIFPPVTTVPAITRLVLGDVVHDVVGELLRGRAPCSWNGGPARECCTWVAVRLTSAASAG